MEYPTLREQTMTDDNEPPPCPSPLLPPLEEAMLRDGNSWAQSFSNLRYGVTPTKKPEEVMAYQGLAEYELEADPEMTRRYQLCLEEQKVQYVRQKLEEKMAEVLRQKREAEEEAAWQQSRQRALLAQQQLAFYSKQYPRYGQLCRREGLFSDRNAAFATAGGDLEDADSDQALPLDESIMSSPTYRFVAQNDAVPEVGAGTPGFARTLDSATEGAREYRRTVAGKVRTRTSRKWHNTSQPPHQMTDWPGQQYSDLPQTPSAGFTPAASVDESDLYLDMIPGMPLTKQDGSRRIEQDAPTPPYHADNELMLDDISEAKAEPVKSPTLSDLIGSETPSEDNDDEADGDRDFDPRSPSPQPPAHRDVKGFGQRNRRASRRTRR